MMCKMGDIILVNKYIHGSESINKHSFVVISNDGGEIQGLDYDLICNVMSSFKDEEQRLKKMNVIDGNSKDGYIKAEQFYYFNSEKLDYIVIGSVKEDVFNSLIDFIEELDIEIEMIIDNL